MVLHLYLFTTPVICDGCSNFMFSFFFIEIIKNESIFKKKKQEEKKNIDYSKDCVQNIP